MRNRWVFIYVLFCLVQFPLYLNLGTAPQGYDFAVKRAEVALSKAPINVKKIEKDLETAGEYLQDIPQVDSRVARWEHNRALMFWFQGQTTKADESFRKSIEIYQATHGQDAWNTNAVSLRYGEFLMDGRRYQEALEQFEAGTKAIDEVQGPDSPFVVRMDLRHAMLLNYLGRTEEATQMFRELLPELQRQADMFDEPFLHQVSGTLDALSRKGLLPSPSAHNWSRTLLNDAKELRARAEGTGRDD